MMKTFLTNIDRNILNHIGMLRSFCGFVMVACYQKYGLLISTHI